MPTVFEPRSFFFIMLALLIALYVHTHGRYQEDIVQSSDHFIRAVSASFLGR